MLPKAVYDFRLAPLTFDFVTFLALAKLYFAVQKYENFELVLVRPFFRNVSHYELAVKESNTQNIRFDNIVMQSCTLIESIKNLLVVKDVRSIGNMNAHFPPKFKIVEELDDKNIPGLTQIPCNFIFFEQFKEFGHKPILFQSDVTEQKYDFNLITLSLRESPQKPERASNFNVWFGVYNRLKNDGYKVIVIPDHDDFLGEKKYRNFNWDVDEYAAVSFRQRLRLYGRSMLNVASPAGWNLLLIFSNYNFLIPGYLDSRFPTSNFDIFNRKGPKVNTQPFWFNRNQKIDWTEWKDLSEDVLHGLITDCLNEKN